MSRLRIAAFLAVLGPGILAGLSDDDPAGITTYSILGADHGYELIWVLVLATAMLILYHAIAVRVGAVTGQGLAGLIRERFGVRMAFAMTTVLIVANLGTTAAEFAGIASALGLAGVPRGISVPLAAVGVSWLVIGSQFKRIEHVLLILAATLSAYILAGALAGPDWSAAARGAVVPSLSLGRADVLVITATIGTTIAPWGLAFIQSYAVDKRLRPQDLSLERIDVVAGAVLTGVIGFFVVIACAATLHATGRSIEDARDAAVALEPLAGAWSARLFGAGLLGAALLAVAIVPLSTAYSVAETFGTESRLDDSFREARIFYATLPRHDGGRSRDRADPVGAARAGAVPEPGAQCDPARAAAHRAQSPLGRHKADGRARKYPCRQDACVVGNARAARLRACTGIRLPHVRPGAVGDA